MKKLNKRKLWAIINKLRRGISVYHTAKEAEISQRWVRYIWKFYNTTTEVPIPKPCGRKPQELTKAQKILLLDLLQEHPLGAVSLETILKTKGVNISHNKIHKFMKENGFALEEPKKQEKRKWVRYARHHSNSLWHVDWTQLSDGRKLIVYEDDASRFIVGFGIFSEATLQNSIEVLKKAIEKHGAPKQLLSDNGTQFRFNEAYDKDPETKNKFQKYLESIGVHQIFTRVHRPQANGKVERLFHTLKRHLKHFGSIEKSIEYYNFKRPHMSLRFEELETPAQAFIRKTKKKRN